MIVDGLKVVGMFTAGVLIVGTFMLFTGLAIITYLSYGENSLEVLKSLI